MPAVHVPDVLAAAATSAARAPHDRSAAAADDSADPSGTFTTVAVTALCDFAARRGDLDLRFTPGPTARQGIEGHAIVAARRGAAFRREWRLEGRCQGLHVVGRADGFDAQARRLEEVKTHRGAVDRMSVHQRDLHWAQAMCYGALACAHEGLAGLEIAIVYFDVATQAETVEVRACTRDDLQRVLDDLCRRYAAWARSERAHRDARDAGLRALDFPHPHFRDGQRSLAEHAWHAARRGRCLLAQAPTGIGKTLAALFPTLKAMPAAGLDKVVFLTAKNSGREPAVATLSRLRLQGAPLRVIELVARDKACVHPDKACHGDSCPLARGFYDRLPAAREQVVLDAASTGVGARGVAAVAAHHAVCPYYLAQEMVRWADVIVADYNHWFDRGGWLHAMSVEHGWSVALLVDEAHNLVERARDMYTATLRWRDWQRARRVAPSALRRPLNRIVRAWAAVEKPHSGYAPIDVPQRLVQAIGRSIVEWVDAWGGHADADSGGLPGGPAPADPLLLECFGQALGFEALAASFGDHAMADVTLDASPGLTASHARPEVSIRNIVPAPYVAARLSTARSVVMFSATLQPFAYYRDMLGLPADTACLEVDSPFRAEQLEVRIAADLSTRWRDRERSIAPIVRAIGERHAQRPGNYLAFFGSYAYMQAAADAFTAAFPHVATRRQQPGMDDEARAGFLARFDARGAGGVAFAVLGGTFAEGIDLPGERLVGAFVATLGMAQPTPVNEAMCERIERLFGDGHAYVYFYPGMRRVVQAAGRVIRTPDDRGVVYLLDDRFAQVRARRVLPSWWRPTLVRLAAPTPG